MYEAPDWTNNSYVDRLAALVNCLREMSEFERAHDSIGKIFQFHAAHALKGKVWEYNPFKNDPPATPFFRNMYFSSIYPELMRRLCSCPADNMCNLLRDESLELLATGAAEFDRIFQDELSVCSVCGNNQPRLLIYASSRTSVSPESSFFSHAINLVDAYDITDAVSHSELWPDMNNRPKRAQQLRAALEKLHREKGKHDASWRDRAISEVRCADSFWLDLYAADFAQYEHEYRERILYTILQIATRRDIDIEEHEMIHEDIWLGGERFRKWNAYVFQMGPSADDRRCSRIYYAKSDDVIYLCEFCPDAH